MQHNKSALSPWYAMFDMRMHKLCLPLLFRNLTNVIMFACGLILLIASTYCKLESTEKFSQLISNPNDMMKIRTAIAQWISFAICKQLFGLAYPLFFFNPINQAIRDMRYKVTMHLHKIPFTQAQKKATTQLISRSERISDSLRNYYNAIICKFLPNILFLIAAIYRLFKKYPRALSHFLLPFLMIYLIINGLGLDAFMRKRQKAWAITDKCVQYMGNSLAHLQVLHFELPKEKSD